MSLEQAAIASNRFGLGARPGELKAIAGDPRGWLKDQLKPEASLPAPLSALPKTAEAAGEFVDWLKGLGLAPKTGELAKLYQDSKPTDVRPSQIMATITSAAGGQPLSVEQSYIKYFGPGYAAAVEARFATATTSERPFLRALSRVLGQSLHHLGRQARDHRAGAGVRARRGAAPCLRPFRGHAAGLLPASRHVDYLDNYLSIGPNSPLARHPEYLPAFLRERMKGAERESGTRDSRTAHPGGSHRLLAGGRHHLGEDPHRLVDLWARRAPPAAICFTTSISPTSPGSQTLLGKTYPAAGEAQGRAALKRPRPSSGHRAASGHEAGAHFIADDPPSAAVDRIAAAYNASGGDLATTATAIVDSPEAWHAPAAKLKDRGRLPRLDRQGAGRSAAERRPACRSARSHGPTPVLAAGAGRLARTSRTAGSARIRSGNGWSGQHPVAGLRRRQCRSDHPSLTPPWDRSCRPRRGRRSGQPRAPPKASRSSWFRPTSNGDKHDARSQTVADGRRRRSGARGLASHRLRRRRDRPAPSGDHVARRHGRTLRRATRWRPGL